MTPIDTAELERLAASITPGPWNSSIHGNQVLTGDSWNTICEIRVRKDFSAAQWEDGRGSSDPTANARAIALVPALIREVLARRKAEAWQPISSAPLDKNILVFRPAMWGGKGHIGVAKWNTDEFAKRQKPFWESCEGWVRQTDDRAYPPTHWQPLPAPPEAEGGQP